MYGTKINNKGKVEKNKKVQEGPCIFPFKHKFKEHNECIDTPLGKRCATSVNSNNTLVTYGYCVPFSKTSNKTQKIKRKKAKNLKVVESFDKPKHSTIKKSKTKSKKLKRKLIIQEKETVMPVSTRSTSKATKRYNEEFISLLSELESYMARKGEFMRSRAYQKGQEAMGDDF